MAIDFKINLVRPWARSLLAFLTLFATPVLGQSERTVIPSGKFVVSKLNDQFDMVINTSKLIELERDISSAHVHNEAVLQVRPMSRNQLLVSAKATGVTQVDLHSPDKVVHTVQVVVMGDARELEAILKSEFPTAVIHVKPITNSVILSGTVTNDQDLAHVVDISQKYYPEVINRIQVIGVHTVMLHTQIMEVSRTKLRELGIDWGMNFSGDFVASGVGGLVDAGQSTTANLFTTGRENFKFGIVDSNNGFFGVIRALRQNNLVKVMSDPTVVAVDGRPASFNSGGEFPILVPAGLGQVAVEFREYGTRLDFVAKVRGDSRIYLEVRPTISEIDPSRTVTLAGNTVPGLRSRFVDTAVELRAGQTLALAGLLQMRTETESIGLPGLAEIPYLGALFRANKETQSEVELLIMVTPDFAGAMDASEVPTSLPGFNSGNPTDKDLYLRGHIEVPPTCNTSTGCEPCQNGMGMPVGPVGQAYPNPMGYGAAPIVQPGYGYPAGPVGPQPGMIIGN